MNSHSSGASDLVMTQADLPPGVDAPGPPGENEEIARRVGETHGHDDTGAHAGSPAELIRDIRNLADRVGGLEKLRHLVDELARMK